MATKQEKAIKSAVTREKKKGIVREEKHVLWLLIAIILALLYLLFAQHNGWWPFSQPKLGSAFYTNVSAAAPNQPASGGDASGTGGSGGSNTGSTANPGNNGGGSTTAPPAAGSSGIAGLAATIDVGDTKSEVSGQANNLGSGCAVVVDAHGPNVGKQEVCTYSQGDKIVTVTYLNDRVVSASKSGF